MRPATLTCSLAILGLPFLAACAGSKPSYYAEPQALEAMRRNAAENADNSAPQTEPTILLTIFLKHDQSKSLEEISRQLDSTGFWKTFPPEGIEIESWKVVMGIGQVVTLRVPPSRLREVNRAIETSAWGAYRTEFYPTYDFMPIAAEKRAAAGGAGK